MEPLQLAQFGYVQRGDEWVAPQSKAFRGIMYGVGGLLLLFALGMGSVAVGQARQGVASSGSDLVTGVVVLLLLLLSGVVCLLYASRFRQAIDGRQRAFVTQGIFGREVLPFAQVTEVRPVDLTVNGAYQGRHYEAFSVRRPAQPGKQGLKVSPDFLDPTQAAAFDQVLTQLLATGSRGER